MVGRIILISLAGLAAIGATVLIGGSIHKVSGSNNASLELTVVRVLHHGQWYRIGSQDYRVSDDGKPAKGQPGIFTVVASVEPGLYVTESVEHIAALNVYLPPGNEKLEIWPVTKAARTTRTFPRNVTNFLACMAQGVDWRPVVHPPL